MMPLCEMLHQLFSKAQPNKYILIYIKFIKKFSSLELLLGVIFLGAKRHWRRLSIEHTYIFTWIFWFMTWIMTTNVYLPYKDLFSIWKYSRTRIKIVQVVIIFFLTLSRNQVRRKNYNVPSQTRSQEKGRSLIQQKNINQHICSVVGNILADFHTEV